MLIREGGERPTSIDLWLGCILAAIAGALNAAVFHAVGFFAANMTGNVSAASNDLALGRAGAAFGLFAIVAAFIAGAFASSSAINAARRRGRRDGYAIVVIVEGMLLVLLALLERSLTPAVAEPALLIGLSFALGFQNAIVTRISNARVRTTHISGMATDIGIELGTMIDAARGKASGEDAFVARSALTLHAATIGAFFAGGVAGVVVYDAVGAGLLLAAAIILLGVGLREAMRARRRSAAALRTAQHPPEA